MAKFLLTLLLVIHTAAALSPWSRGKRSVNTVFSWKTVAYGPMDRSEKELIGGYPFYIRKNIIPTAMAYHEKTSMLYIAAPRLKPGVVATLNSLDLYETFHLLSPIWSPYPNAQMNELKVKERLESAEFQSHKLNTLLPSSPGTIPIQTLRNTKKSTIAMKIGRKGPAFARVTMPTITNTFPRSICQMSC